MATLGVNLDHVATLRQVRGVSYPDPVHAVVLAELGGADGITIHLREDRRHIQDRDLRLMREVVQTKLNLEMACTTEMVEIASEVKPDQATLVPERREELTTEGGLDVKGHVKLVRQTVRRLQKAGIRVSLFIEPASSQIRAAASVGAEMIEIHTGAYANAVGEKQIARELSRIRKATREALRVGLEVNAGHGLHYKNTAQVAGIPGMGELNIGHSIIARAVFVGLERAVYEMAEIIRQASQ
jgi:pyridoxine 5-phosphate synthase